MSCELLDNREYPVSIKVAQVQALNNRMFLPHVWNGITASL